MLVDTHAHLFWEGLQDDLPGVIERARAAGVEKMIVPGTDLVSSKRAVEMAREYPGVIYAAVGIHPEEAIVSSGIANEQRQNLHNLEKLIIENRDSVVAVGEVGMDESNEQLKQCINEQRELFHEQCLLALKHDLPLIIHTRESVEETLRVIDSLPTRPRGQFHCFGGSEQEAREILTRGFYMSFCGNVSWSKRVRRMTTLVPDDRLLLETDSPFMTPVNEEGEKVGTQNEPANVTISAQIIARERGTNVEALQSITTTNVSNLFGI